LRGGVISTHLGSSRVPSSGARTHIAPSPGRRFRARSSQVDTGTPAGRSCRNPRPAIRPCSSIVRRHRCRVRSTGDPGSRLHIHHIQQHHQ